MNQVVFVNIDDLKTHERTSRKKVGMVIKDVVDSGILKNPVVADRKTLVVLDGHHRLAALKKLGAKKIPVFTVNYLSKNIRVYLRRKNLLTAIIKQAVIDMALDNKNFPEKTTRHLIKNRLKNINIAIKQLR